MKTDEEELIKDGFELKNVYKTYKIYSKQSKLMSSSTGYYLIKICNQDGKEVYSDYVRYDTSNKECYYKFWEDILFDEEELISPCPTMEEFRNREFFLINIYIQDIPEEFPNWGRTIYDPVSDVFVALRYKNFVQHHIWLYAQLKKSLKPTIFPLEDKFLWSEVRKMLMYIDLIPLADEDDPTLPEARKFVRDNADEMALDYYEEYNNRFLVQRLIDASVVSKETLDKLLEIANKNGDTEMMARILNQKKKETRSVFDL